MLWHTGMACGVHSGIVLICLVLAEHVCCSWATQAQSSRRQSGNGYVGFSQQNSGLGRFGGSHLQNQLRQPSAQSSSTNTKTAVSRGLSRGLPSGSYTQTLSQPAQSGPASVRLVQSSSLSKPNWAVSKSNAQEVPKKWFAGLSTTIASVSSFSKHNQYQNRLTDGGRRPAQDSHGAAAETQSYDGQRRRSPKKSSPFSSGPSPPQRHSVRMQTSATAPGRRMSSHRRSKPSQSSNVQNERTRSNGQTEAGEQASSHASYGHSLPVYRQNAHVDLQPHGLVRPTRLGLSYKPGSSSRSNPQASWNSRNPTEGAHDLPATGSHRSGTSGRHFAPTRTYIIPHRLGGYAIKRLAEPADQKEDSVRKPQQVYRVPPQQAYRVPPQQAYRVPPQQAYRVPPQQAYRVPSQQVYRVPSQQAYRVPPQHSVSVKPPVQSAHPEAKWKRFRPSWSLKVRTEDVRG